MACFKTSTVVHPSEQPNGSAQEDGRDAPQRAVSEMPLLLLLNDPKAKTRANELKQQIQAAGGVTPTPADRNVAVINLACIDALEEEFFHGDGTGQQGPGATNHDANPSGIPRQRVSHSGGGGAQGGFVRMTSAREHRQQPGGWLKDRGEAPLPVVSEQEEASVGQGVVSPTEGQGHQRQPSLEWTASRKALEVLVVREEQFSRTHQGLQRLTHDKRLEQRLERLNLDVLVMEGDGNCQFRTLSQQLFDTQDHHHRVRKAVIRHMRSHREEFECFLGEDFDSYLTSMARLGTWGDELTLRAACDAFGVVMHVVTSDAQNWYLTYEPTEVKSDREVFLTYVAPIHYNALRRRSSLRILSKQLSSSFKRIAITSGSGPLTGGSGRLRSGSPTIREEESLRGSAATA